MRIFDKRPLALILCIAMGSFAIFTLFGWLVRIIYLIFAAGLTAFTFLSKFKKNRNVTPIRIGVTAGLILSILSILFFDFYFLAYKRFNGEVTVTGVISDVTHTDYSTDITLNTENIDHAPLSSYKIRVHVNKLFGYELRSGTRVSFKCEIEPFTSESNFDAHTYYVSCGFSGLVTDVDEFKVISHGKMPTEAYLSKLRENISNKLIENSNKETGGLISALLLGERDRLNSGIYLSFKRIGITHTLALSGMHLSILVMGLAQLLSAFGLNKKKCSVFLLVFTILYMTLVGFPVSIIRAGIMLIITTLLFLLAKSHDSITSLFISATLIILIQPYAVFDLSLWLSVFATLGIVVIAEETAFLKKLNPILTFVISSLLSSLFALLATSFITILSFSEASLLSIPSTLLFSIPIQILLYFGIVLLLFGSFIPLGTVASGFGGFIALCAEKLSGWMWVYNSVDFLYVRILAIILAILTFLFFILNVRYKRTCIATLTVLLTSVYALSFIGTSVATRADEISYYNEENEILFIKSDGELCICDIGEHGSKTANSLRNLLSDKHYTYINKYVAPTYSSALPLSLKSLLSSVKIDEIYLPSPEDHNERYLFRVIEKLCSEGNVKISTFVNDSKIKVGSVSVSPYKYGLVLEEQRCMVSINDNNRKHTYFTLGMIDDTDEKQKALEIIDKSHTIIVGRQMNIKDFRFTYQFRTVEDIIFADKSLTIPRETQKYYLFKNVFEAPKRFKFKR